MPSLPPSTRKTCWRFSRGWTWFWRQLKGPRTGSSSCPRRQRRKPFPALALKLQESVQAAFELASSLRHGNKHHALPASLATLHRIKKEGDLLHDAALKELGANSRLAPQAAVTCKEAYDRLLAVLERSAALARLVSRLLVKYA